MTDEYEKRSLSKGEWAAVVLAVAVVGVATWVLLRDRGVAPPANTQEAAEAAPSPGDGPGVQVSDADARVELEKLGSNPAYRRWLAQADDLVRRWAAITDNLDHGESPRKALEHVGPTAPFRVIQRGAKSYIAPDSYARYDEFAAAVDSIDVQVLAGVYRTLHPAIETAYRALGYPGGSLDAASARALRRLEAAPVAEGEVEVVPDGGVFVFADPKLEGLQQVEKHLLRMGPDNERLIQGKARAVREALGLATEPAAAK